MKESTAHLFRERKHDTAKSVWTAYCRGRIGRGPTKKAALAKLAHERRFEFVVRYKGINRPHEVQRALEQLDKGGKPSDLSEGE